MFHLVYCSSPLLLTLISILIIIGYAVLNFRYKIFEKFNNAFWAVALFLILYATVLRRSTETFGIELRPFYTFVMATKQPEFYRTLFMNAFLFVPFGISMPYTLSKDYNLKNYFITIFSAFCFSSLIEFSQYYFSIGVCEVDDVIFNTLGAAIGTLSYFLYGYIIKKGDSMNTKISIEQKFLCALCANSLFDKKTKLPENINLDNILNEAKHQTVLPITATALKKVSANDNFEEKILPFVAKNMRVNYNHTEIANLFTENKIKYVFIKGVASASYYKQPDLRTMGDVDVLINRCDIQKINELLQTLGYSTNDNIFKEKGHIAYIRNVNNFRSVCEVHFNINGIPDALEDVFNKYFQNIFETVKKIDIINGKCLVPSDFQHGIILLLHTATHLTSEGVGLRHLCDWAVFVNRFSNEEFVDLFSKPLKEMGMWKFAQLLTLCCQKYLGVESKLWAGEAKDALTDAIIIDILNGGNFGFKDKDRYGQIKYITGSKERNIGEKGVILQLFSNINNKAKGEYKFTRKSKLLLPLGWIAVIFDYIILLLTSKRKIDGINTLYTAKSRQNIYSNFELFKK